MGTNKIEEPNPLIVPIISASKANKIKAIYSSIVLNPLQDNKKGAVSKASNRYAEIYSASLDELILLSLRFRIKFGMTIKLTFETVSYSFVSSDVLIFIHNNFSRFTIVSARYF